MVCTLRSDSDAIYWVGTSYDFNVFIVECVLILASVASLFPYPVTMWFDLKVSVEEAAGRAWQQFGTRWAFPNNVDYQWFYDVQGLV